MAVPDEHDVEAQDDPGMMAAIAEGPQPTDTVASLLRKRFEAQRAQRPEKDMILHGYGEPESELHVVFGVIKDYENVRNGIVKALKRKNLRPAQRDIQIAVETLSRAWLDTYALVDGVKQPIGEQIGLALYAYLFPDKPGPMTDAEAMYLLFDGNTTLLVDMFNTVDRWMKRGAIDSEEDVLGN